MQTPTQMLQKINENCIESYPVHNESTTRPPLCPVKEQSIRRKFNGIDARNQNERKKE